eukprot:s47_g2.t2
MKWRLLAALSAAIILGALFSSYVPDLHGSQTGLSSTDKIMISKAGAVRSTAPSAPGFLSGGGLLAAAEDVEFAQPISHDVTLDIPPVFKCNPFDHTLVVNLEGPGGEARRNHILREFGKKGLRGRFKFWPAVNFGTDEQLAQETGLKKCPCDAKKGCALSHRRIYETMLAEQWACATIFEDDVTLAENFTSRIESAIDSIPPFDVILWGFCPGGAKPRHGPKDQSSVPILRYGWPGSCVHAYTVSLQGALMLTQANTPVQTPPDGAMDGMHWFRDRTMLHIDRSGGVITGSYWFATPQLSWQGVEADNLDGGEHSITSQLIRYLCNGPSTTASLFVATLTKLTARVVNAPRRARSAYVEKLFKWASEREARLSRLRKEKEEKLEAELKATSVHAGADPSRTEPNRHERLYEDRLRAAEDFFGACAHQNGQDHYSRRKRQEEAWAKSLQEFLKVPSAGASDNSSRLYRDAVRRKANLERRVQQQQQLEEEELRAQSIHAGARRSWNRQREEEAVERLLHAQPPRTFSPPPRLREQGSLPATPRALSEPGRPSKATTPRLSPSQPSHAAGPGSSTSTQSTSMSGEVQKQKQPRTVRTIRIPAVARSSSCRIQPRGVALAELLMSRPPEAAALNLQLRRCALNTEGALHVWHAARHLLGVLVTIGSG